jgi:hypothetical protein
MVPEGERSLDMRILRLAFVALALTAIVAGAVSGAVFPTVTLSDFDPATCTYTYHVSVAADNTYAFGQLFIYAYTMNWDESTESEIWTMGGPVVGGVDQGWQAGYSIYNEFGGDTAEWLNNSGTPVLSSWEGDFILVAPGSSPVMGIGQTKDGVLESLHTFDIEVPGVPEPSSILALGSFIGLAVPIIRRRNR